MISIWNLTFNVNVTGMSVKHTVLNSRIMGDHVESNPFRHLKATDVCHRSAVKRAMLQHRAITEGHSQCLL